MYEDEINEILSRLMSRANKEDAADLTELKYYTDIMLTVNREQADVIHVLNKQLKDLISDFDEED